MSRSDSVNPSENLRSSPIERSISNVSRGPDDSVAEIDQVARKLPPLPQQQESFGQIKNLEKELSQIDPNGGVTFTAASDSLSRMTLINPDASRVLSPEQAELAKKNVLAINFHERKGSSMFPETEEDSENGTSKVIDVGSTSDQMITKNDHADEISDRDLVKRALSDLAEG